MTKRIDPDLFARLMEMSSEARRDLLEFLGQTPADAEFVVAAARPDEDRSTTHTRPHDH